MVEQGKIIVSRVRTGLRRFSLGKPGYDSRELSVEIKPGENFLPASMKRATISLIVKTTPPRAEVYLDNLLRGLSGEDGVLRIPDLDPGTPALKVTLAGHQPVERPLSLTLDRREVTEVVKLTSILETAEFTEYFKEEVRNWTKTWPPGWTLAAGPERGLRLSGDAAAFVNKTSIPNVPFNQYGDFLLVLNVKLVNGKGASWVVRARDERNYYLIELATSKSRGREKAWNFYVCRDGKTELKDSQPVLADIEKPDAFFRIALEARGRNFTLKIMNLGDKGLGPTFSDDRFPYGGIGFQAIDGLEMFVTEIFIQPRN
jgi:hypothetical protein